MTELTLLLLCPPFLSTIRVALLDYSRDSICLFLFEYEIDGEDEADESSDVVPMETLSVEKETYDDGKYCQRDNFLNHF